MKHRMTNSELAVFSGQLFMFLHSGISLPEGISILMEDLPEGEGKEILIHIKETLEHTGRIGEALEESGIFPAYFIQIVEIGDRSGTLEEVMNSLSCYYTRQDHLFKSIHEALVSPFVLLGMLFSVLIVLTSQVMPVFAEVFQQLGLDMSGPTGTIFQLGWILQTIAAILLILLMSAAVFILISIRSESSSEKLYSMIQFLPIVRKTTYLLTCSRFFAALSLTHHSGLDACESFALASGLISENRFKEKTDLAGSMIEEGANLSDALRESGLITGLNAYMLSIGFRTGNAENTLNQISVSFQEEADARIQSAVSAVEPVITAILSVLAGLILVSVMLPLLGVMSNIG